MIGGLFCCGPLGCLLVSPDRQRDRPNCCQRWGQGRGKVFVCNQEQVGPAECPYNENCENCLREKVGSKCEALPFQLPLMVVGLSLLDMAHHSIGDAWAVFFESLDVLCRGKTAYVKGVSGLDARCDSGYTLFDAFINELSNLAS